MTTRHNGKAVLAVAGLIDHAAEHPEDWRLDAACRDHWADHWFPPGDPRGDSHLWDFPRTICQRCPVAAECLKFALDNEERHGMWGASTPQQRDHVWHRRGQRG